MKKRTSLVYVLVVCLLLCLIPASALAASATIDGIEYSFDDSTQTAAVVRGNPTNGIIRVPDAVTYNGTEYAVTSIGEEAFYMKTYQEVYIGANVKKIESNAFGTSFDVVRKIQFNGSLCQSIASDAFDWMTFSTKPAFQLIVCGPQGCMDTVIAGVVDFQGLTITYEAPAPAEDDAMTLQKRINAAPDHQATTLDIQGDLTIASTVTVPAGKIIILTDDGTPRTLANSAVTDPAKCSAWKRTRR